MPAIQSSRKPSFIAALLLIALLGLLAVQPARGGALFPSTGGLPSSAPTP